MNKTSNDDEETNSASLSLDRKKTRASQRDLVKRIYYPETLFPDNYSFFADRTDPNSNLRENPPIHILNMDADHEYRNASSTDPAAIGSPPNQLSNPTKLETNEIEIVDRTGKYTAPMMEREHTESETGKRRFDVKRYVPSALKPQDKNQPPSGLLDPRFYSMKKTAMTILCLLIIIMSNSVQLKHVLNQGKTHSFYGTQIILGIVSVMMCAGIGVILMYVMRIDLNDQYKQHKLDYIDNCVICFLFILAIFNIFIAACS